MTPRPRFYSGDYATVIAERLFPKVKEWLASNDGLYGEEGEDDDIKKSLADALKYGDLDGYALAKELDDWSCDAELVEILDRAHRHASEAHSAAVKAWVVVNNIQPQFKIGDIVTTTHGPKNETVVGKVTEVYEFLAEYRVTCPSLGHVETPDPKVRSRQTIGFVVPFEDVSAVQPEESPAP